MIISLGCHPERGRVPTRIFQRGRPESKDLGFLGCHPELAGGSGRRILRLLFNDLEPLCDSVSPCLRGENQFLAPSTLELAAGFCTMMVAASTIAIPTACPA